MNRWHFAALRLVVAIAGFDYMLAVAPETSSADPALVIGAVIHGICWALLFALAVRVVLGISLLRVMAVRDANRARKLWNALRTSYWPRRPPRVMAVINESAVLLVEDRPAHAVEILSEIDPSSIPRKWRSPILNNLADALSRTGEHERAISTAREALQLVPQWRRRRRGTVLGTLGEALSRAGSHAEAVIVLEEAISLGGCAASVATRSFYLAESYRALGRAGDAQRAYASITPVGGPEFARYMAQAEIEHHRAQPFR